MNAPEELDLDLDLSDELAAALLKEDNARPKRGGGGGRGRKPKVDVDNRHITVWMKLNHTIRLEGCDNPDCNDPRITGDRGRNVVSQIHDKYMCRYCFLEGYMLP